MIIHRDCITGFCCKQVYQFFCIIISFFLKFFDEPFIYTVYCFLKGINIHIRLLSNSHTIFILPATLDLFITGTVDITLILYCFLSTFIYNSLLLCCQPVINLLIDTEEQTVINCIPHRTIWLHFLYTCRIDSRKRVFLSFYSVLLKSCVCFGPVHVGCICSPSLITFHKKIGTSHTNLQVLHIIYSLDFMFAVGQLTESVFCNTHAVKSVFPEDFFQFFSCCSVKLGVCIVVGVINKWQRYHIESWVKCRIDQIGMHGNLYRVSVHQRLDSLGLVSVCQLVCCINIDFDFSSGGFFHQFTELASAVCPGACLCG